MLFEGTVGMIVLALSIGALIGWALRDGESRGPEVAPRPTSETVIRDGVAERAGAVSDLVQEAGTREGERR